MIAAYREPDRARGRELMVELIESLSQGVPAALTEVITLSRTLTKRTADVLAYIDRPGTCNGPTEAVARADSNTSAAPPSASATSPTTSPGPCSKPVASGAATPRIVKSRASPISRGASRPCAISQFTQ